MAKKKNLYVAFVWHMHQPFYRDLVQDTCSMPWVRLHATKDYYDLVAILEEHPNIKQTFNLVPSLLLQLQEYVENNATDDFLEITRRSASKLTKDEKQFLLDNFFMANEQHMIAPYPRYRELAHKRKTPAKWTTQDYLDLQVWFNLTWFGYIYKTRDKVIKSLIAKGKKFTEADKKQVIAKQWEIMGKVITAYKSAWTRKQIELTTTPFYHPILPLLCDTDSAQIALPHNPLPVDPFKSSIDAEWQIREGLAYFKKLFGRAPKGMWPSEGSVSPEVAELVSSAGVQWIATDEAILKQSMGLDGRPTDWPLANYELFAPWQYQCENGHKLNLVFRDHNLSDTIGFRYSAWPAHAAADDLINMLKDIQKESPEDGKPLLVSIILDGENAWECFPNNGWDFLSTLYKKLANETSIKTTTVSEYIQKYSVTNKLNSLYSGSWIDNNFFVWIGYEKANKAWTLLAETRHVLQSVEDSLSRNYCKVDREFAKRLERAWQEIYIAEGSDWFWWYSDFHSSACDAEFDRQFRLHLQNVYALLNLDIPEKLTQSLFTHAEQIAWNKPQNFISPSLEGNSDQWNGAGVFITENEASGAMTQTSKRIIKQVFVGQDHDCLYLRLDPAEHCHGKHRLDYLINIDGRNEIAIRCVVDGYQVRFYRIDRSGNKVLLEKSMRSSIHNFIELMIPLANLGLFPEQKEISIKVFVCEDSQVIEMCPTQDTILFELH